MMKPLPPSASHLGINAFGFACSVLALLCVQWFGWQLDMLELSMLAMAAAILPIMVLELLLLQVMQRPSAGLSATPLRETDPERVAVKLVGLIGTLWLLAFLYWVLPEYHKEQYQRFWLFLSVTLPFLVGLAIPYFWWMDSRMHTPEDAYHEAGLVVLLQLEGRDWPLIGRHFRDWLVKAFFLPLMFSYVGGNAQTIAQTDISSITNFRDFFHYANNFIFYADLIFAAVGYCMTFRFLDSHIRSSEPTVLGWLVAVVCYAPFWQMLFYAQYFDYDDGFGWMDWLSNSPPLFFLWGMAILALEAIYGSATVCLGYRFSNLTYRGLVANGAYRFTKHPAYVAKNLSWWLISIPFISHTGFDEALRHCVLLFGVNLIYYARAKTEENHLSRYPEYVEYALAMNERSLFAPLARHLPFLQYKAPEEKHA